jgi:hypothetical protein
VALLVVNGIVGSRAVLQAAGFDHHPTGEGDGTLTIGQLAPANG